MRILKLKNDYGFDRTKNPNIEPDAKISLNYLHFVVGLAYKDGFKSDNRRLFAGIWKRAEQAVKDDKEYLELNEYEFLFIKGAFETAIIPKDDTKNVTILEEGLAMLNPPTTPKAPDVAPSAPVADGVK